MAKLEMAGAAEPLRISKATYANAKSSQEDIKTFLENLEIILSNIEHFKNIIEKERKKIINEIKYQIKTKEKELEKKEKELNTITKSIAGINLQLETAKGYEQDMLLKRKEKLPEIIKKLENERTVLLNEVGELRKNESTALNHENDNKYIKGSKDEIQKLTEVYEKTLDDKYINDLISIIEKYIERVETETPYARNIRTRLEDFKQFITHSETRFKRYEEEYQKYAKQVGGRRIRRVTRKLKRSRRTACRSTRRR